MSKLKKTLFDKYNGFADKRIKKLESDSLFIVDDRSEGDYGADKKLFLWFCSVFAVVDTESSISVSLVGGVPRSAEIESWIVNNNCVFTEGNQIVMKFSLQKGEEFKLLDLASLFENIVAPGKRYSVPAYKYVCPRTANTLRKLAANLLLAWAT